MLPSQSETGTARGTTQLQCLDCVHLVAAHSLRYQGPHWHKHPMITTGIGWFQWEIGSPGPSKPNTALLCMFFFFLRQNRELDINEFIGMQSRDTFQKKYWFSVVFIVDTLTDVPHIPPSFAHIYPAPHSSALDFVHFTLSDNSRKLFVVFFSCLHRKTNDWKVIHIRRKLTL